MEQTPDLSIIVTTYNRLALLQEAINSVAGRLACEHEIIVADDGSTDDTRAYLQTLSAPIRVILAEHGGVQVLRNRAMREARGRYLKFLDDDDVLEPQAVMAQVGYMDANPHIGVSYGDWGFVARTHTGALRRWYYQMRQIDDPFVALAMDWWPAVVAYMFRKSAVEALEWNTRVSVLTDTVFAVEAALNGAKFGYVPTAPLPLGWYRAITAPKQRMSARASNVERARAEFIVFDGMAQRLRQAAQLTPIRAQTLAARYYSIARRVFPDDRALFRQFIHEALALDPAFQPEGKRYRRLIRWFGYANAERLRRVSLKVREVRRTVANSPPEPVNDELIVIQSYGRTAIPKY